MDGTDGVGSSEGVGGGDAEGVLVEVYCVGVVSGSNSVSFVVVVVLEDFALVLWCSSRMALWCWNERGNLLRAVAGNM